MNFSVTRSVILKHMNYRIMQHSKTTYLIYQLLYFLKRKTYQYKVHHIHVYIIM